MNSDERPETAEDWVKRASEYLPVHWAVIRDASGGMLCSLLPPAAHTIVTWQFGLVTCRRCKQALSQQIA